MCASASAQQAPRGDALLPWQLAAWKWRQVADLQQIDRTGKINTGYMEILGGPPEMAADGRDIRLLDDKGRAVPIQLVGRNRDALKEPIPEGGPVRIHFEITDPAVTRYAAYWGNPDAPAEPPGKWERKLGSLVLEIRDNTLKRNAANWKEMNDLLAASSSRIDGGARREINDTENPYGPRNENFLSIYKGMIYCPVDGRYAFGTDSDDSSFLLVDGVLVAQWPGGHNPEGKFTHFGRIELKAGMHKIEYYHVQTDGGTLARAGWQPPGAPGFTTIPEESFVRELQTAPLIVECRERPTSAFFKVKPLGGMQFGSRGPVFTTMQFTDLSRSALSEIVVREWDFGDGSVSRETNPTHVFIGGQTRTVTLRVTDTLGFEGRFRMPVTGSTLADNRVDVDVEMACDALFLMPGETANVTLKSRVTSLQPLSLTLVTEYWGPEGKMLRRERDALSYPAPPPGQSTSDWIVVARPAAPRGMDMPCGDVAFRIEYQGTEVATRKLCIRNAADRELALAYDGDRLTTGGMPVALRLSAGAGFGRAFTQRLEKGGDVRVMLIDDSLAGTGDKGYATRAAEELQRRYPGATVIVKRVGLDTTGRGHQPLRHLVDYPRQAKEMKADLVVLAASLRDVLRFMPVRDFERTAQAMAERVEAIGGVPVALVAPPPTLANPALSQDYAVAVKTVGLRRKLPVADMYSAFMRYGVPDGAAPGWRALYRDADSAAPVYHMAPTARGQDLMAATLVKALLED
jgi:hypothetical protein